MLKIVVDATPITPKPSGVGLYVTNLLANLLTLQNQEDFELGIIYQPRFSNWLKGNLALPEILQPYTHQNYLPIPVRISNILINYFPQLLSSYLKKYSDSCDIIHGTNYSVFPYTQSLKVITIYDLAFLKYPEYIDAVAANYGKKVKKCLQWTDLIIAISESTKRDIIEYLDIEPEKIWVTPLASRYTPDYLSQLPLETIKQSINYDFSQPYILFVSTIEPRKNITALITAFNYLKREYAIAHNLLLVGKKGWRYEPIFESINNSPYKQNIYHLDYLTDQAVAFCYSMADVFAYPSRYEGFGLPVLEAMTLGTPVVTSYVSSLPEVAGDAALTIDPNEPLQLAEAIYQVISSTQLNQELILKGKQRAQQFSWQKTAQKTVAAYKALL
ncbi:MAG: glycosyltransferase family 1 protein [Xenococcaceae cyanobacterium MO_167.B27]|nr:glycosyltransferase family 1 protein [Xenococcaceae cyanobacterium MO_167.B27]